MLIFKIASLFLSSTFKLSNNFHSFYLIYPRNNSTVVFSKD